MEIELRLGRDMRRTSTVSVTLYVFSSLIGRHFSIAVLSTRYIGICYICPHFSFMFKYFIITHT